MFLQSSPCGAFYKRGKFVNLPDMNPNLQCMNPMLTSWA